MPPKSFLQVCLSHSWGGLELVTFEYAKDLANRGFNSWVIAPAESPLAFKCLQSQLPLVTVEPKSYFSPRTSGQLRRLIKKQNITTVVLHQLKDIWLVTPALIGLPQVTLLGFGHTFLSHSKKDLPHTILYKRLAKLAALTDLQKQNLIQHLPIAAQKIEVIANWVDSEKFNPNKRSEKLRAQFGVEAPTALIALVGRLDGQKGQIETLEAAAQLRDLGFKFKLVFVGEETLNSKGTKAKMLEKIAQLHLADFVILTGFLEDPAQLMASLDIFLMPSYLETFGKVLIEAMASGVACISTDAGGVPDIIDNGKNGILIPARDPSALAKAMAKLLNEPNERNSLGQAARVKAVETYAQTKITRELDRFLGIC